LPKDKYMPLLELQKLTKCFGGLTAVNELDLSIEKGEIVGLIGPNGAGKTTVFNIISGVFRPTRGKVLFKDEDITALKPHSVVRKGLVRTFQLTTLFGDMTILENILLGFHLKSGTGFWGALFNTISTRHREEQLFKEAAETADFMGLGARQHELSKNTSHGHQRMLQMAIGLAASPELILLDEPVTGMNAEETNEMMNKISDTRDRGITILLVEHDMRLVMDICDRICVLDFGKKIAEGFPQEICENKEVIAAYLGTEYATRS
jgi:branched-chain amino acid transport system ATP-binding protein